MATPHRRPQLSRRPPSQGRMGPRSRAPEAHPHARLRRPIYDFRTMAERVNARLKDEFAPYFSASAAHSRSNAISCSASSRSPSIRSSVSSTTGPPLPDPAGCTRPAQEKSPRSGCYARSSWKNGPLLRRRVPTTFTLVKIFLWAHARAAALIRAKLLSGTILQSDETGMRGKQNGGLGCSIMTGNAASAFAPVAERT